MKKLSVLWFLYACLIAPQTQSEDRIKLETTTIKGNSELPKILYVVPWSNKTKTQKGQQKLVLHSLFGDFFDPVLPPNPQQIFLNEDGSSN